MDTSRCTPSCLPRLKMCGLSMVVSKISERGGTRTHTSRALIDARHVASPLPIGPPARMLFSVTVLTGENTFIQFLFHLFPRSCLSSTTDRELFVVIRVMEFQGVNTLFVAAVFTLASFVFNCSRLQFSSPACDCVGRLTSSVAVKLIRPAFKFISTPFAIHNCFLDSACFFACHLHNVSEWDGARTRASGALTIALFPTNWATHSSCAGRT